MKIENNYEWSTHQPLLRAALDVLKPKFILELGMGIFSTPIFINSNPEKMICIENDELWLNYIMKMDYKFVDDFTTLFHKLDDDIKIDTHPYQLNENQKNKIINYYEDLLINNIKQTPKLLFVDNFTCCRNFAINSLYKHFEVIIYHDCQAEGILCYEYNFVDNLKNNFVHYLLKTPSSWTGIFMKYDLELNNVICPYITQYCNDNTIENSQIYLVKQNLHE